MWRVIICHSRPVTMTAFVEGYIFLEVPGINNIIIFRPFYATVMIVL